jgi:hypothetical protein
MATPSHTLFVFTNITNHFPIIIGFGAGILWENVLITGNGLKGTMPYKICIRETFQPSVHLSVSLSVSLYVHP